jgi:phosphorylase kinase alpha/beta subunit
MNIHHTIEHHIGALRELRSPSGLFMASAGDVATGYNKAWLRDNVYTSLAFEAINDRETVVELWRALLDVFLKHEVKINWAIENKPFETWQYIHARYNPETFEEYWEEWGNKQHDAIGAVLFKLADLEEKDYRIARHDDDKRIVQKLVDYLANIEYWHDPDSGIWEEYEEVHASSVGAVAAGLEKIDRLKLAHVPDGLVEHGREALSALLPRESHTKFADLAQLSLIYPYNVVDESTARQILENVEYHLVKERGVIRYKTDRYYNRNSDGWSEEAEWTFGFPWLAIIYNHLGDKVKAEDYLKRGLEQLDPRYGQLPELYYSNSPQPNENIPLAWSESMLVAAMVELEN